MKRSVVEKPNPGNAYITSIEVADHLVVVSSGSGESRVLVTTDGKHLRRRQVPAPRGLRRMRFIGKELWCPGEYGQLSFSTDHAATWTAVETPTQECLWDIARDAKGTYWMCGSGGLLLRGNKKFKQVKHALKARSDRADPKIVTTPSGLLFPLFNARWDGKALAKAKGLKGEMCAAVTGPSGTIVMVGDNGVGSRSTDGGVTWRAIALGVKANFNDVAIVDGEFVAVGDKGSIRRSSDDGLTWKAIASSTKLELWSIGSWGSGAFIGGGDGIVLKLAAPTDTYWREAIDEFAPKPIVTAGVKPLVVPSRAARDAREAELVADAAAAAGKVGAARIPVDEHDAAILDAIDDIDGYRIYGDYLQSNGDVRGELVALETAKHKDAKRYAKDHAAELLDADLVSPAVKLVQRWGFIEKASLHTPDVWDDENGVKSRIPERLAVLLAHPAARFLKALSFGILTATDNDYGEVIDVLRKAAIPSLRELHLGDFDSDETETSWSSIGNLSKIWPALPNLETLLLHSGSMTLGRIVAPKLKSLTIQTGGFSKANLQSIDKALMPRLERLSLWFGQEDYGSDVVLKDLRTLLHSDRFPRLSQLGIVNFNFTDALCEQLHTSPLVAQLTSLDLSKGTLSDIGARSLATYARGLAHLEQLNLSSSYLSPDGLRVLKKALPTMKLITERQRYRANEEWETRYTALGE